MCTSFPAHRRCAATPQRRSALPPKADNKQTWRHVRFVPKAVIVRCGRIHSPSIPDGLSVLKFIGKASLLVHRFDPTRSPSTRFKWIAEILRFPLNLAALELHDADRIGRLPVVEDYIFGNS